MASYGSTPARSPQLTTDQVVGLIDSYEQRLRYKEQWMAELVVSPSYVMLTDAPVGSVTRSRYGNAVSKFVEVGPLVLSAAHQISVARGYLNDHGAKGRHRQEMIRLLTDRWYQPDDPFRASGPQGPKLSMVETLDAIGKHLADVQAGVDELDALWMAVLPEVQSANETVEQLQIVADDLGLIEPDLGRTKALAADLAERLTTDPLSVTVADGPNLAQKVDQATAKITKLRTEKDNLASDLVHASELVVEIRSLRARAESAAAESRKHIGDLDSLISVPSNQIIDGPKGISARLESITGDTEIDHWHQRRARLNLWFGTARKLRDQLVRAEKKNRSYLETRNELRGRLKAYEAKAASLGLAENLVLDAQFDEARDLLYINPIDIKKAEVKIAALATRLSS